MANDTSTKHTNRQARREAVVAALEPWYFASTRTIARRAKVSRDQAAAVLRTLLAEGMARRSARESFKHLGWQRQVWITEATWALAVPVAYVAEAIGVLLEAVE